MLTILCNYAEGCRFIKVEELAERFDVSVRTIRYDLDKIDYYLKVNGYHKLERSKGQGLRLCEDADSVREIRNTLGQMQEDVYALSKSERALYIRLLLFSSSIPVRYEDLADKLYVSRKTVIEDVRAIKENENESGAQIGSTKTGICYTGREYPRRRAILDAILQMFSPIELWEIGMGVFPNKSVIVERAWYDIVRNNNSGALEAYLLNLETQRKALLTDDQFYLAVLLTILSHNRASSGSEVASEEIATAEMPELLADYFSGLKKITGWELDTIEQNYIASEIYRVLSQQERDRIKMLADSATEQLLSKVSEVMGHEYYKDNVLRSGLHEHMIGAFKKIGKRVSDNSESYSDIREQNQQLYDCIVSCLSGHRSYDFGPELKNEASLIMLHFCASDERRSMSKYRMYKALIVCASGIGTSKILAATVSKHFPQIRVIASTSIHNVRTVIEENQPDFLLTTVPISCQNIPVLRVNAVMTAADLDQIRNFILAGNISGEESTRLNTMDEIMALISETCNIADPVRLRVGLRSILGLEDAPEASNIQALLRTDTVQVGIEASDWEEAIRLSARPLVANGSIESRYIDAMIANIKNLGPYIVILPGVAMPHALAADGVFKTCMSLTVLKRPVVFGNTPNDPVKMILCLGATDEQSHMKELSELVTLLGENATVDAISNAESVDEVLNILHSQS